MSRHESHGTLRIHGVRVEHARELLSRVDLDETGEELAAEGEFLQREVALLLHGAAPDDPLRERIDAFCVAVERYVQPPTRYCPTGEPQSTAPPSPVPTR